MGSAPYVWGHGHSCEYTTADIQAQSSSTISTYYLYRYEDTGSGLTYNLIQSNSTGAFTVTDFYSDDTNYASNYYVRGRAGNCWSSYSNVDIEVMRPEKPSVIVDPGCYNESALLTASGGYAGAYKWYDGNMSQLEEETGSTFDTPPLTSPATYYVSNTVEGYSGGTCESLKETVQVGVVPSSSVTGFSVSPGTEFYGGATPQLTLSHGASVGNVIYESSTDGVTWPGVSSPITVDQSTQFRAKATNQDCPSVYSNPISVSLYPLPVVNSPGGVNYLRYGNPLQLSTEEYDSYQWIKDGQDVAGAVYQNFDVSEPGLYSVRVKGSVNAPETNSAAFRIYGDALEAQNLNHISTITFLEKEQDPSLLHTLNPGGYTQSTTYFDGLGRPMQTVVTRGSPQKRDVVQPIVYDDFGREAKKYLPFTYEGRDGLYVDNNSIIDPFTYDYAGDAAPFYDNPKTKVAPDDRPFAETVFEPSPLNRVLEQGAPGTVWQPGTGNTIKKGYQTNGLDEVRLWTYTAAGASHPLGLVESQTSYAENQLFKNVTTDEHGMDVIEYVDKEGRTVLKRVQAIDDPSGSNAPPVNDTNYASTYYIYDDFGQLVCVIQPDGVKNIASYLSATDENKESFLQKWAFRYRYDGRRRMILKQVPGSDSVVMVYDVRDRLVLTQDGNQRDNDEWLFTKYDELNRPVMTGIYTHGTAITQKAMAGQLSTTNLSETFDGSAVNHGYTNVAFPSANLELLTVTYYDNYDFRNSYGDSRYEYVAGELNDQPDLSFDRVRGHATGTKSRALGTSDFLRSITYYDDRYRPIQTITQNHKGGVDRITTLYDFTGKVMETKTTHSSAAIAGISSKERIEYDHAGRVTEVFHTVSEPSNAVVWIDKVGVLEDGKELLKTGSGGAYDAAARTKNYLEAGRDGWFEVTAKSNYRVLIGFSDEDIDANYTSIDYAIYLSPGWGLTAYENGLNKGSLGTYTIGDVIRIERINGAIQYKKNGTLLGASTVPSLTKVFGDVSLFYTGDKISEAKMSTGAESLLLVNQYNELGQLIDKALGGEKDNYIQSMDYRYNIRGWLTSINNAQLNKGNDTNNEIHDLFGMELLYNTIDASMGNEDLYNGNISAVKWKTPVDGSAALEDRKGYRFTYDPMNRLRDAAFGAYDPLAGNWNQEQNAYNETLTYDLNGNIQTLHRNTLAAGTSAFLLTSKKMDSLRYTYSSGNQLSQVEDIPDPRGFKNGSSDPNEYRYDENGNLIRDLNKGIDSIVYNHLNLPALITFSNGNTIQYTYTANGEKLQQAVTENTGTKVTDYIGSMVYERDTLRFFSMPEGRVVNNDGDYEYQFMLKDHLGNTRVLYGDPFEGTNLLLNSDCNTLDYFINAQNVTRTSEKINGETYIKYVSNQTTSTPGMITWYIDVKPGEKYTFKAKGYRANHPESPAYLYVWTDAGDLVWPGANLPYGSEAESWVFNDFTIPEGVTKIRLGIFWREGEGLAVGDTFYLNEAALFKHEDEDYKAGFEDIDQADEFQDFTKYETDNISEAMVYAQTGTNSYLLTGAQQLPNQIIGAATNLKVYPGDIVNMEVYGKYSTTTGGATNVGAAIASALQNAFRLSPAGATDLAYQAVSNLFGNGALIGTVAYPQELNAPSRAFLNYILFDENYIPYDFGYDQLDADGKITESTTTGGGDRMSIIANVRKPGYIYIYISNENEVAQEVYFDDLAIKHVRGVAEQQNDYYPFGLTFNSYQRENSVEQRWKFQGQEHIDDLGLNWDSFKWRNHQPDIGRFFNVDPLASDYVHNSPYAFAENRVTNGVELEGLEWAPPLGPNGYPDPEQAKAMVKAYGKLEIKASYGLIFGLKTGLLGVEANFGSKELGSMSLQNGIQPGADNKVTKGLVVSTGPVELSLQTEATTEKGTSEVEVLPGTGLTMPLATTTKTTEATAGFSVMGIGMESSRTTIERKVEGFATTTTQSARQFNGTANLQSGSPTVATPTVNNRKFSIAAGIKIEIGIADEKKK